MRIKQVISIIIFILFAANVFAQQREYSGFFDSYYYKGKRNLNFTVNGGISACLCDMAKMEPGPAFGVGVNYKLWPRVMFGTEFHYIMLSGKDNQSDRNLAFTSTNLEFLGYGRFYLLDDIIRIARDRGKESMFLKIYVMTGIGLAKYSASTSYTQPSPPTDSMFIYNEPGSGLSMVVPAALGFSWRISNRVSLITEVGYRLTFTDRLDGISARGNPKDNDGYLLADIKIQFSPFMPKKKKAKSLPPPEKYEGPKGTETWKNRKKEEPAPKRNNYYYQEDEPQEEQQYDEFGNPIETPKEEQQYDEFGNPIETPKEEVPQEEEPGLELEGWD